MSKTLYLSEISGRFIKYEDNPVTSHTPQLLASDCFLSKKGIQRLALNFQAVFLQFEEWLHFSNGPREVNQFGLFCVLYY